MYEKKKKAHHFCLTQGGGTDKILWMLSGNFRCSISILVRRYTKKKKTDVTKNIVISKSHVQRRKKEDILKTF